MIEKLYGIKGTILLGDCNGDYEKDLVWFETEEERDKVFERMEQVRTKLEEQNFENEKGDYGLVGAISVINVMDEFQTYLYDSLNREVNMLEKVTWPERPKAIASYKECNGLAKHFDKEMDDFLAS